MEAAILTFALSIIREAVKNPEKKRKFRAAMLKIRDAINAAFPEG
jgi:hypothetical protein